MKYYKLQFFSQLFGEKDPDNDVAPEITKNNDENQDEKQQISTRSFAENCAYDPVTLFNKVFIFFVL